MNSYKIISEETLEKLVCSNCDNYLSYGKSKIGSKNVICGRCDQKEAILPFLNENIDSYLFPCINRFDNCHELLHYSEVPQHEENCLKDIKHTCSECKYSGNGCQLYHHYIKKHPANILKYPVFNIHLLNPKKWNYLHRNNNNLFVMTYEVIKFGNVLKLSLRSLGKNNVKSQIVVKSSMEEEYLKTEFQSEVKGQIIFSANARVRKEVFICQLNFTTITDLFILKNIKTVDNSQTNTNTTIKRYRTRRIGTKNKKTNSCVDVGTMTQNSSTVQNKDHYLQQIENAIVNNLLPKMVCSKCRCYVIAPIFKCPSNHVRCEDCNSSFCYTCDDIVNWTKATDLEAFSDIVPLPCRWNCNTNLLASDLRIHEKNCTQRKYNCVQEYCSWTGSLNDLQLHWHSSVKIYSGIHQIYGFNEGLVEFYLIYDKEIFYCRILPLKADGRQFHVRKISNVSPMSQKYRAGILVTHRCDRQHLEKDADLKLGGITYFKKNFFDYFGQCKNYKIIFYFRRYHNC